MSAPPFFQSAGRGDLLFWGRKEGPSVVLWESLSEQGKSWLEELSTMHDWVVWCKSKNGAEEIRSFEFSGKEIFSNYNEMLGSQRSYCHNKTNSDSSEGVGRKGRMSSTTDRYQAGILDGRRDRQIRMLRFLRHSHSW